MLLLDFIKIFPFLLLLVAFEIDAAEDWKERIDTLQASANNASKQEKGKFLVQLSQTYWCDQNPEKAFETFLTALENAPIRPACAISLEEQELYDKALQISFEVNEGVSSASVGFRLCRDFEPIVKEHPDYLQLNFLVANGFANSAQFEEFFESFYRSYCAYPDHYLAYKCKAILHLKLLERTRSIEEKELRRRLLTENLSLAIEKCGVDVGLYKMLMVFATDNDRPRCVESGLNKILSDNMILPRADIAFFVQQAVTVKKYEEAQRLIDKARSWYPVSRVVDAAQKYLDQHK